MFRALGSEDPPATVTVGGQVYLRTEIFKHDSWAATALYTGHEGQIVCKFNRMQSLLGISMAWIGRRLAARERLALERLADLPNVPNSLGDVFVNGERWPNAIARRYVAGHPLRRREVVPPGFFETVDRTLAEMHRRGIAYVDLHKRENIIVGDDGQPYMIDFQICYDATHPRVRGWPGAQQLLDLLRDADRYHFAKHVTHHSKADDATAQALIAANRPWWISAHRKLAVPFRELRRRLLVVLGVRSGKGRAESEQFAEDAVRRESQPVQPRLAA
jgi:predicted Ser/Thr protein kinase